MPAARGVKRTASKAADVKPAAGSSKSKKKPEPKLPLVSGDLKVPKKRGQVFTVGQGDVGQLGLGEDHLEKTRFTRVSSLPSTIVDICAGGMHTVALDKDGNVWTFGCNDEGALGRDTEAPNSEWAPSKVALPGKAVSVSAGDSHTAALLTSAQVFAWGSFRDSHGNMGLTLKGNERKPVEMLPGHRVVQIASGGDHLVMLTDMGQVFTCGCGEQGQLGRVTARSCDRHSRLGLNGLLVPAPLVFTREKADFEAIWAGTHCTFARRAAKGDIYVWGLNNYQQIGVRKGSPQTVFTPVISEAFAALETDNKWIKIAGGQHHTLALDKKGQCYSLGRREYGRLGLGEGCEDAKDLTPVPALEGKKCISISCGSAASFAVTDIGEVWAWGMGSSGQLGTGKEDDEVIPKLLCKGELEGRKAMVVTAGGQHTVLLVASEDTAEDEVEEAEKGDTAPHTKVEDDKETPMEVDDKDAKSEKSDKDAGEEKKAGRRAPAKRGRKRSNSASSTTESKPPVKKQNGGSPVPEETAQEVAAAEKKENEEVDGKPATSTPEAESKAPQEEGKSQQSEEKQQEKEPSDDVEEPKSKKIKLDDDKAAPVETTAANATNEETKPQGEEEKEKPTEEVTDSMEVDEKLSNGNGEPEEQSKPQEVKVTKEVITPSTTTTTATCPEKEEAEKMDTATEVAAS